MRHIDPDNPYDLYALLWFSLLGQWQADPSRSKRVRSLVYWMDEVQYDCLQEADPDQARLLWAFFSNALPGWNTFWTRAGGWAALSRSRDTIPGGSAQ